MPLPDQDCSRWDRRLIAEGFAHLEASASGATVTAFHIEAEIAAIHAAAPSFGETDWLRVTELFERLPTSPAVRLNRAVAIGYRDGPAAGLAALAGLDSSSHLLFAACAEFLSQTGDVAGAVFQFALAAARARTEPERRYLLRRGGLKRTCVKSENQKPPSAV